MSFIKSADVSLGGGGGGSNNKRSCRREKPKMSFVFFVLFCSFSNHAENRSFCAEFGQKCVLKKEQKDHDFCLFCSFLCFFVVFAGFG